jgi:M6 family metalloprotease-like protein
MIMRNDVLRKALVLGIIIIFLGTSVLPCISGKDIKNGDEISITNTSVLQKSNSVSFEIIPPVDYPQPTKYKRSLEDILTGNNLPSLTSNRPLLVILADYSDLTHNASYDKNYYENMMWGPKPSLSTYYSEVSYGKFTFIPGAVIGWYPIDANQSWVIHNPREYVIKAVNAADEDFDYAMYDTNNDGVVTNEELTLVIVFPSNTTKLSSWCGFTEHEITTNDGVLVEGEFCLVNEWDCMGVFAHELGHAIGLPDLYDTVGGDSVGIGVYGLMGLGINCGPSHTTAWSKIQLGWLNPTIVKTNGTYNLKNVEKYEEALILFDPGYSTSEYFLIENRWKGDSYDGLVIGEWRFPGGHAFLGDLPDEGIVIYHIDDKKAEEWWINGSNVVNSKEEHKCVDVECADSPSSHFIDADDLDRISNTGDAHDLWDKNEYTFDDFSVPCNANWYDNRRSGISIQFNTDSGSEMSVKITIPREISNPITPTIFGPLTGKTGIEQNYTSRTFDANGDQVYYFWNWGDGTQSEWLGPYNSGETCISKHMWNTIGKYDIKVKVKDTSGNESDWATLTVTMPYSYNKPIPQFLELLFQRFPTAFPLLRHMMEY